MYSVCRTCLRKVSDKHYLALTENAKSSQIKIELSMCVPEVTIDLVSNPAMCLECVGVLHSAYDFKRRCLQTEERIRKYVLTMDSNRDCISLIDMHKELGLSDSPSSTVGAANLALLQHSVKPRDVVDELNSLLDDALDIAPSCPVEIKKKRDSEIVEKQNSRNMKWAPWLQEELQDENQPRTKIEQEQNLAINNATVNKYARGSECPDNSNCSKTSFNNSNELSTGNGFQFKGQVEDKNRNKPVEKRAFKTPVHVRLKQHQKIHTVTKSKTQNENLHGSLKSPTKKKVLNCTLCNYKTGTSSYLNAHLRSHGAKRAFVCKICDYRSTHLQNFNTHIKKHGHGKTKIKLKHSDENVQKVKSKTPKKVHCRKLFCHVCGRKIASEDGLKRHMINHKGKKPFACDLCGFKTAYDASLKRHMRMHMPFACTSCGFKTDTETSLQQHNENFH